MHKLRFCLAIASAMALAGTAQAVTLNFNNTQAYSLAPNEFYGALPNPYVESGFSVSNDCAPRGECMYFWGPGGTLTGFNADPTGNTLNVNWAFTTTTVQRTNGGVFDLTSLDMADSSNDGGTVNGVNATLMFTFQYASGTSSSQSVTLDALRGLQTFQFNKTGLTRFSWVNTNDGSLSTSQVDNIVMTVAAVPEPGTWALMLGGVAALGAAVRRRNRA